MEKGQFRGFLLSLSKQLSEDQFQQLKYVLEGYIPSATSEAMKQAFLFFGELERRRYLTPTNFEILKEGFRAIERHDLIEELEGKEQYFRELFNPQLKDGHNLEQKEYAEVCDGTEKEDLKSSYLPPSDHGAPKVREQMANKKDDDLQLQEFEYHSSVYDEEKGKENKYFENPEGSCLEAVSTANVKQSRPSSGYEKGDTTELTVANSSECPESVIDVNDKKVIVTNELPEASVGTTLASMSKHDNQVLDDDDVVPDCGDVNKESEKASVIEGEVKKGAQGHQSPIHSYGGARPKQKADKCPVSTATITPDSHGHTDQEYGVLFPDTGSGKQAMEGDCTSPPFTCGDIISEDVSSFEGIHTSKQKQKAETSNPFSGKGPGANDSSFIDPYHTQGLESHGPFGTSDHSLGLDSANFGPGPQHNMPVHKVHQMDKLLQQQIGHLIPGHFPTSHSPKQPESYDKAGYSVVISSGELCHCSDEMGIVMMESGTQFYIAIANNNNCDAEVDITFGGIYLGVWLVEAKRTLSNPLIVEGCPWAAGRLKFYNDSDTRTQEINKETYGEVSERDGIIKLEFKPEVEMLHLFVQHLHNKDVIKEISMPNFKTATVSDLKQEINKKFTSEVACVIMSGEVLEDERTMSSYALENKNEVIEVLLTQEELLIDSTGRDQETMLVDPFQTSVEDVKIFIENKMKIPADKRIIIFYDVQNMCDANPPSLSDVFLKAKQKPIFKVYIDRPIKITVLQPPNEKKQEVEVMWFDTVDKLKQKLEERDICSHQHMLKFSGADLNDGRKQLVGLGIKNKSEIVIHEPLKRSTHRGFSSAAIRTSRTRGFGQKTRGLFECDSDEPRLELFHSRPHAGLLRSGRGIEDSFGEKGRAVLFGNEKRIFDQFQEDKSERKFSKEKAVTLVILLRAKRSSPSPGTKSTRYPPPVPE
ncbi:uncharacterized protein [Montipora foliosa]|uniref:uncharacterized protein n=1 Tax=Montipora foliosa TaxID=591990 RepID=UPI0035F185F1